jgi:uncharacterized phage protein (TIGR01671 family)
MREILFRGKAINREKGYHRTKYKNGDWVYGLVTNLYDARFPLLPAEMRNTDGVSCIDVDHKTIGQYTGLTDKNGNKIFEGDIVKGKDNLERNLAVGGYIDHENGSFVIVGEIMTHYRWLDYELEVIGNIYDNLVLLNEV